MRDWLPESFPESRSWVCHSCGQVQTITQAREHPSPVSIEEHAEALGEEYVTEAGDLQHDRWVTKGLKT